VTEQSRVLGGRYELQSRLGRGGMATVFRGSDRVLGRSVAVKVLASTFAKDGTFVERFRREAQAAAGLNHPNVVAVFDTGSDDGVHYIVMEYVEGRTLADVIREEGALPPTRAAEIAATVCRALSSAHEKGMVHRDVKPGNVLLTSDGGVKVADFGIARVVSGEPLTVTGSVMGTASYLSPEQATGSKVDRRSDIYALGCVLYEMLTGRIPFEGDTPVSIVYKHVEEEPTAPSSVNPAVPSALEAVVKRAMAKSPADRYQSADEMARDLRHAAAGSAPQTTVASSPEEQTAILPVSPGGPASTEPLPITGQARRRWWPFAVGAIALATLGLGLALTLGDNQPPPTDRGTPPPISPSPSPSPSVSPSPEAIPSVDDAFAALGLTVANAGEELGEDAEEILDRAEEAFVEYREQGNLDEALQRLGEIEAGLVERTQEGQISTETASPIVDAVRTLALAMQADPPQTTEEGGGRGKGKGKGKGGGGDGD
jgi:serine/threonine protein kinase